MDRIKNQKRLARLIKTKFGGNKTLFGKAVGRSRQQVFNWLTGRTDIPHWVWDHVSRISIPKK